MPGRWLTFDCFGTLVDWRHGMATSAELLFPGRGAAVLEACRADEAELEQEKPHLLYRDVLTGQLRRAAAELSLALHDDDADLFAVTLPHWPVFPDVAEALTSCRADGWRLALLTNCDRDLIALTRRHLPVPFEVAVTAEDVAAYKPDPAHFRHFRDVVAPEQWLHIAQSHFHDIRPCHALGIPCIWINRLGEAHDPSLADLVRPDLVHLPEAVTQLERAQLTG